MRTRARRDGDDWVLNGTKMWITNGSVADVAVVWAQTDESDEPGKGLRGFLVPTDTAGFSAPKIEQEALAARLDHLRIGARGRPAALPTRCCPRSAGCAARCRA